ncbi:MAG: tRNA (adenosine(37)-N6)-dimethylallyltransferase MiaA [Prevotella sp.]
MITILGPTASGKTKLAVALATKTDAEIISADSRQVYRGMDIGTGKDLGEYTIGGRKIPYHLIDICDAGEKYNVFQYQHDFLKEYNGIISRGKSVILCGGTGLYLESVLKGYRLIPVPENPDLRKSLENKSMEELTDMLKQLKAENHSTMHNTTDVDTAKRAIRAIEIETYYKQCPIEERQFPHIDSVIIGVDIDRDMRRRKITERLAERLKEGLIEEVEHLINKGVKPEDLIYYGLEYKYVTEYVTGQRTYEDMFKSLETAIHQFAKRQMTWFRGMERRGFKINWIDASLPTEEKTEMILLTIKNKQKQ